MTDKTNQSSQLCRITPTQARMARAAIKMNKEEIAKATGCAIRTIFHSEHDADKISRKNAGVIRSHYEGLGVQFWADAYFHVVAVPKR